jgi:hypothetical protein
MDSLCACNRLYVNLISSCMYVSMFVLCNVEGRVIVTLIHSCCILFVFLILFGMGKFVMGVMALLTLG